ncbi:dihydrofolate reductase, partial [Escherichia coli]|nr:dihydrofolate reductase [Escherichia coli]
TKGGTVVMGRRTFESLRSPLKGRENWVLSRTMQPAKDVFVARSVESLLELLADVEHLFIIGGAEIYTAFMPYATELILTVINGNFDCDTFFPQIADGFKATKIVSLTANAKVFYYERR